MMGAKTTRLLAAVMFTDIVGYTAMMQEDEEDANRQKERHRQVLKKRAAEFNGNVLHYYGDGALTIFNSAYHAVMCAINIQHDLVTPHLPLRIGIHIGDIAYNDEDVYGDAVNIASRLESLSIAGGILISQKVFDEINNQEAIQTKELGIFELKNVKRPTPIFAVSNKGINIPAPEEIKAKSGRGKDRLAVLPFLNMSDEKGFDYFSDGLTEEIINGLTKMNQLEVVSRTSVFAYKGQNEDVRTIGEKLKVSYVLEGSVRKNKDKIRVTAQLIETGGGFHLWSEIYEHHLKDIFEIQDGICQQIIQKIQKGYKSGDDEPKLSSIIASNKKGSYEYYLEGLFELQKHSISSVRKAMKNFNTAIEADPEDVKPQIALCRCFLFLGMKGQMASRRAYKKVMEGLDLVLKKEPDAPEPLALKAIAEVLLHRDYSKAVDYFKDAFEANSDSASLLYNYFLFLTMLGKAEAGVPVMEQALKMESTNVLYNAELARAYHNVNRFTDALEQYNYTLQLDSSFLPAIEGKGWTYVAMGKLIMADNEFEAYQNLVLHEQKNIPHLIYTAARLGMDEVAQDFLEELQIGDVNDSYIASPVDIARVFLGMGKYDEVFFYLQRAVEDRIGELYFVIADPIWDNIKRDPRYADLLDQLKLPDAEELNLTVMMNEY